MDEFTDECKSISFDVTMNRHLLYDFSINHVYTGTEGVVGTCFGALAIIVFLYSHYENLIALAFGIILILYYPVTLKSQSAKQILYNPVYKNPIHYDMNEEGITVSQGEESQMIGWDKCIKAVSTKQSIAVYTGKRNAFIFPRKQLADKLPVMLSILSMYMEPKKIKIRY